ncbi:MAG: hypothetical protein JNJ83_15410 [Verrucomicrobiaceae bacterium]|nr:hypothetical protein [Verrucomicrobiaceae bacterium]
MKQLRKSGILAACLLAGMAPGEERRLVWQPVLEYLLKEGVTKPATSSDGSLAINPFVSYTHIGTDFGFHGPGGRYLSWENGRISLALKDTQDWAGMWHSLAGQARDGSEVMDFARAYGGAIVDKWQPRIVALLVNGQGKGRLKMEIKSPAQELLWQKEVTLTGSGNPSPVPLPCDQIRLAKFLNWTAEPGSEVSLSSVRLGFELPAMSFERYVLLSSYAKLFRCYAPVTGMVRDRAHIEQGAFESTPATGLFGLATAIMAHPSVQMVDVDFAKHVVRKIHTNVEGIATAKGLLPHFVKRMDGQLRIHPGTEYSTVDTALYSQSMLLAAQILNDSVLQKSVLDHLRKVQIRDLVLPNGAVSHGLRDDGSSLIPFSWRDWGGETALVMLMARMIDPTIKFDGMDGNGKAWQGTGFIAEIQSLLHPDFDSTTPDAVSGVNWLDARKSMLKAQKDYFPAKYPGSFAAKMGLFGLSAGEGALGTRYEVGGVDLPAQELIHPHYILMAGSVDESPKAIYDLLHRMEHAGYFTPWGLVENITADGKNYLPMFSALNACFETLGAYHLLTKSTGTEDIIHRASRDLKEIRAAMKLFYPTAVAGH